MEMIQLETIEAMVEELETMSLSVVLVPQPSIFQPSQCMIRVVTNQNPLWYRDLCADYPKQRGVRGGRIRRKKKK